jgi:hypothetical protein
MTGMSKIIVWKEPLKWLEPSSFLSPPDTKQCLLGSDLKFRERAQTDKPMVLNITGLAEEPTEVVDSPNLLMQTVTPMNWTWVPTNNGVIISVPTLTGWITLR